ncbi:hypothetical protein [Bythopirellula goksoeyrii]|nr:hypothetical protein [Bythopirellula goksoeyrii]
MAKLFSATDSKLMDMATTPGRRHVLSSQVPPADGLDRPPAEPPVVL